MTHYLKFLGTVLPLIFLCSGVARAAPGKADAHAFLNNVLSGYGYICEVRVDRQRKSVTVVDVLRRDPETRSPNMELAEAMILRDGAAHPERAMNRGLVCVPLQVAGATRPTLSIKVFWMKDHLIAGTTVPVIRGKRGKWYNGDEVIALLKENFPE